MTRRHIGGHLDLDALRLLYAPPHLLALQDAYERLRQACAALRACEHPDPRVAADLARLHASLRDELAELDRLRGAP